MGTDKVIDRIQKLRRLSESTNVNEAATAAAEAQRLMTAHRISEAQLASETGAEDETVTDVDVLAATGCKTPQSWLVTLASGIAEANGCGITIQSSTRRWNTHGGINMYGRQRDLDAAKYLFFAMHNEINRLADRWTAENPGRGRGATISFKLGAAGEIANRMRAEKDRAQADLKAAASMGSTAAGGAIMVIDRARVAVDAKVKAACGGSKASWGGSGPSDYSAYNDGAQAGRGVSTGSRGRLGGAPKQIGDR